MKILLSLDGTDLAFIFFFIVVVVAMCVLYQRRERSNLSGTSGGPSLRKVALYAAFLALGVLFLFGKPLAHWLANLAYGVQGATNLGNASGAAIEADATVGGWVTVGTATSKIILTVSFYVLSYIIPWVVQQATHPAPTAWAKKEYTDDFKALTIERKFEAVGRLSLSQSLRFMGSVLAAALIQ